MGIFGVREGLTVAVAAFVGLMCACGCRMSYRGPAQVETVRMEISESSGWGEDVSVSSKPLSPRIYKDEDLNDEYQEQPFNTVLEDGTGEVMGQGKISPVTVTARHRNIAERNGKIRISFDIHVPATLLQQDRQIRILPELLSEGGSLLLDRILVTGEEYRRKQDRGYERYNRYFASIIPDSVDFVKAFGYLGLLKYFTQRNLEDRPHGEFNITETEAIGYYIKHYLVRLNRHRKEKLEEVFAKCVKDPADRLGVRLDTVLENPSGGFVYRYVQDLDSRPDMHRLRLTLGGSIHGYGKKLSDFQSPDTLTYYVSSLVQLADTSAVYREHTLERDVSASTLAFIEFQKGSWEIDTALSGNLTELSRIRSDMDSLMFSKTFASDSILVEASCSPEGSLQFNTVLSEKRAQSVIDYFSAIYKDSKERVHFKLSTIPENWELLREMVERDSSLRNKAQVIAVFKEKDLDKREGMLARCVDYPHILAKLYPRLRRIMFRFYMHRRIYDTIRSKVELDEAYIQGLRALQNRNFKAAVKLLRPYSDLNSAIAYLCLDYNASALEVLRSLEKTPVVKYLTALTFRRLGNRQRAEEYFRSALADNPRLRFRASLDPEMEQFAESIEQ